jgi:hypothetical protein
MIEFKDSNKNGATTKMSFHPSAKYIFSLSLLFVVYFYSFTSSGEVPNTAIVVLGGGLLPDGNVPEHTQLRLKKAKELYHEISERKHEKVVIITLSGGTTHKPNPLNSKGFPIFEATAAAKALIENGIPARDVYEECFSLDTVGNVSILSFFFCDTFTLCRQLLYIRLTFCVRFTPMRLIYETFTL